MPYFLKTCCCCCSLRIGGFVLGWLGSVFTAFIITGAIVAMANADYIKDLPFKREISLSLPFVLTAGVVGFVIHLLLLIGASIGNPLLLLPFLIIKMVTIVLYSVLVILGGPYFIVYEKRLDIGISIILVGLMLQGVILYWWLCILSLYKELREISSYDVVPRGSEVFKNSYIPPSYAVAMENEYKSCV